MGQTKVGMLIAVVLFGVAGCGADGPVEQARDLPLVALSNGAPLEPLATLQATEDTRVLFFEFSPGNVVTLEVGQEGPDGVEPVLTKEIAALQDPSLVYQALSTDEVPPVIQEAARRWQAQQLLQVQETAREETRTGAEARASVATDLDHPQVRALLQGLQEPAATDGELGVRRSPLTFINFCPYKSWFYSVFSIVASGSMLCFNYDHLYIVEGTDYGWGAGMNEYGDGMVYLGEAKVLGSKSIYLAILPPGGYAHFIYSLSGLNKRFLTSVLHGGSAYSFHDHGWAIHR